MGLGRTWRSSRIRSIYFSDLRKKNPWEGWTWYIPPNGHLQKHNYDKPRGILSCLRVPDFLDRKKHISLKEKQHIATFCCAQPVASDRFEEGSPNKSENTYIYISYIYIFSGPSASGNWQLYIDGFTIIYLANWGGVNPDGSPITTSWESQLPAGHLVRKVINNLKEYIIPSGNSALEYGP